MTVYEEIKTSVCTTKFMKEKKITVTTCVYWIHKSFVLKNVKGVEK